MSLFLLVPIICLAPNVDGATIVVGTEPQLFLDDHIIARKDGLARVFHAPKRRSEPVLDFPRFETTQHHTSVIYDPSQKLYRFWFTSRGQNIRHAESKDGIHWTNPKFLEGTGARMTFGVMDDRGNDPSADQRFKLVAQVATSNRGSGMGLYTSADGLRWTPYEMNPVVPHWPDGVGNYTYHKIGDIIGGLMYDPVHKLYRATFQMGALPEDGFEPGPLAGKTIRRLVGMSVSKDCYHWQKPWRVCVPDEMDDGLLEFYGMRGIHVRGSLLIGFVRVLRDDLPYEKGAKAQGIGYTVLAISRDGRKWHRFREPFLDRNPVSGTWDRAVTWIGEYLPMGDEAFLYYGGYSKGHKPGKSSGGRQMGLARMRLDGYASLRGGPEPGTLETPVLEFSGNRLSLNVDSTQANGEVRVGLQDASGNPLAGFTLDDCDPIRSNKVAQTVSWKGNPDISTLADKRIRLQIRLRSADLYAVQFRED